MKKLFYFGVLFGCMFEILNVYFIMPMPGSQEIDSIGIAYFLYTWRWVFRIMFALMIFLGFYKSWNTPRKWVRILALIPFAGVAYLFNFVMVADKMFLQPGELILADAAENKVPLDRLVIGIEVNGESRAYPIEYMAYHHQVQDQLGGKNVLVTYCSVCRTGRVYEPTVDGKPEKFRLVGMDHFNAMFEDESTGSWWRQVSGEAITGTLTGKSLPEIHSVQMTLSKWLTLYPNSLIMQEDPSSVQFYDPGATFEKGTSTSALTGTNPESWKTKSWIVGLELDGVTKAYDWNQLVSERIINDKVNGKNIILVLGQDGQSFAAFENSTDQVATITGDTLVICNAKYNLAGVEYNNATNFLPRIRAYQEFWHSWKTFHPDTEKYTSL